MSIRNGKWTSIPNDEQIRREANREYWKFRCPMCGNGCGGMMNDSCKDGNLYVTDISCNSCEWHWFDPIHHPKQKQIQTTLEEFII